MPKKLLKNKRRRRMTKKNKKQLRKKRRKSRKRRNLKGGGVWSNFKAKIGFGEKENPEKKVTEITKANPLNKADEMAKNIYDKVSLNLENSLKMAQDKIEETAKAANKAITGDKKTSKELSEELVNKIKDKMGSAVKDIINGIEKEAKEKKECPCCNRKFDEEKPPAGAEKPAGAEEKPAGAAEKPAEEAEKPAAGEEDDSLKLSFSDFDKK